MKNDPLVAKLYNKMQQEQNEYRAWLLAQPPEEILNHAYEYSSREDILIALENASLRPAQMRALLESQAPLADIYKDYRDCDTNTLDVMALCIADRADTDLMESTKKNWPPVYYQTGRYAREHEELPQYRASMKLNEECRDEIDDAISYNYNGLCRAAGIGRIRRRAHPLYCCSGNPSAGWGCAYFPAESKMGGFCAKDQRHQCGWVRQGGVLCQFAISFRVD